MEYLNRKNEFPSYKHLPLYTLIIILKKGGKKWSNYPALKYDWNFVQKGDSLGRRKFSWKFSTTFPGGKATLNFIGWLVDDPFEGESPRRPTTRRDHPPPPRLRQTGGENKIYMNLFFRNIQILHSSDRITAERERENGIGSPCWPRGGLRPWISWLTKLGSHTSHVLTIPVRCGPQSRFPEIRLSGFAPAT